VFFWLALSKLSFKGDVGDIVIVGFPHDEGVKRNGGRVGAAKAPAKFRECVMTIKVFKTNFRAYFCSFESVVIS
jgi:arginase family enzyme